MKLYAPNYYKSFHCIADKCRHSCCIGWEIDVDEDSLAYYRTVEGDFGKRLQSSVVIEESTAYFRLEKGERCPFLNEKRLCDMILALGEDSLCQICRDHPRFRSFFSDREEIGLGLCCEEASRLILSQEEKTEIILLEDDGEAEALSKEEESLLSLREKLFAILQTENEPLSHRIDKMLAIVDERPIAKEELPHWISVLRRLERMDPSWDRLLDQAEKNAFSGESEEEERPYEKLLVYFLYRHLPDANDWNDVKARVRFALLSTYLIKAIAKASQTPLAEVARLYSSEVEYSTDNTETLLCLLAE